MRNIGSVRNWFELLGVSRNRKFEKLGMKLQSLSEANPRETRFGLRYREVQETEGSRNRDSTLYRETARKHPGNNIIPVNPEFYGLIKGHAPSCKCLRVQIDKKRMSLVQPYFEYYWLNKTAMIFVPFNLSDLFLIGHLSHSTAWLLNNRASDRSQKKKSNCAGVFGANFTKKQSVKNDRFCGYFQGKFRQKSIGFALIRPAFLTFF